MMASEYARIREELRSAVHGGAWHGPAVLEAVDGMNWRDAWMRAAPGTHAPVEIVLHIASWLEIVAERHSGHAVRPDDARDWPDPGEVGEDAWRTALRQLEDAHARLDAALTTSDDAHLRAVVPGQEITMYRMLHGVVQHTIYHAGQIVLLRRIAAAGAGHRAGAEA